MLSDYMDKAMQHAHYELIEDRTYFATIPGFEGLWANAKSEQACHKELREVLEGWILLGFADVRRSVTNFDMMGPLPLRWRCFFMQCFTSRQRHVKNEAMPCVSALSRITVAGHPDKEHFAMPRPLPLDFLIVSTAQTLHLPELVAALNEQRVGVVDVTLPAASAETTPRPGLERVDLGRLAVHETLGRVDVTLVFERHARPVMSGLAPAALDRLMTGLDGQWQAMMSAGTLSVDVRAAAGDPDRVWCLRWLMGIVERVASQIDGVLFDPAAQRCLAPETLARIKNGGPVSAVTLHSENWGPETRWLHTHGLQKFGQPELEIVAVPQTLEAEAATVLRTVAETLALSDASDGPVLHTGMRIDCEGAGWLIALTTQTDADHGAPFGRLRLVTAPPHGQAPGNDATEVIVAAAITTAQSAIDARAWTMALRHIDQVLAALPEHPVALAAKGRYLLARGEPQEALALGAFLALRAPQDPRGYFIRGLALGALGRPVEALDALSQAIARDPDDPDLFETRARVADRLGHGPDAAADRARATMLRV